MKTGVWLILLCLCTGPVSAQEFSTFLGVEQETDTANRTLAGQIEYKNILTGHFAWSLSYLNEGHFPNHHRDGALGQIWYRIAASGRLVFSAGAGPYYYFDTTTTPGGRSYSNDHGWGALAGLDVSWAAGDRLVLHLRTNWVEADRSFDTFSVLFGVGYRFPGRESGQGAPPESTAEKNEVTVLAGRSILNSFSSETGTAASFEYRRRLWHRIEWTLAWLSETNSSSLNREGVTSQLWAVQDFLDDRLSLGAGGGIYRAVDSDAPGQQIEEYLAGIFSLTARYRFSRSWHVRVTFNRIHTGYDRDADGLLAGIGCRF